MRSIRFPKRKAIALILAYTVMVSSTVLLVAIMHKAFNEYSQAKRNILHIKAMYLAEGAVEQGAHDLAQKIANYESFTDPYNTTVTGMDPDFTVGYSWKDVHSEISGQSNPIIDNQNGIITQIEYYLLVGSADYSKGTNLNASVKQVIAVKKTFTFQHAVFYADDLEMLPGPDMTLSGKVHSNSDIYIGANSTFTIDSDYLKTAGSFYNHRKNDGTSMPGDVSVKIKDSSPASYALVKEGGDTDPLDCDRADWRDASQTRWNGTVQSSIHGVTTLAVPAVGSIQVGGYYDSNADVKVENGTIKKDGFTLVEGSDIPPGTIQTSSFYNQREGKMTKIADIDLRKLAGYAEGDPDGSPSYPNNLPSNGLLYATRSDAAGDEVPGVRLVNGGKIYRTGGLTVVSNVSLYIQGDFNDEDKKPAAVICDSMNILSNSWDDVNSQNSSQKLSERLASDTTVNTAFIAGIKSTPDGGGNYSGGLENYPRLLEDWSPGGVKKDLTIRGSFVELWESSVAQGDWSYGGKQYEAPVRNWDYDTDFNDASKLPPFTPFAVETESVSWYEGTA